MDLDLQTPVNYHEPILAVPSVPYSTGDYVKTLDEVLVALWLIVKKFEDAAALLRASGSESEGLKGKALELFTEQQRKALNNLKVIALSDSHVILKSPGHILAMLGHKKMRTQDLTYAATALLKRQAKKFEIWNNHRMGHEHHGLMLFASRVSAPFLVLCGPTKQYTNLDAFLFEENVQLTDIMCEKTFLEINKGNMTVQNVINLISSSQSGRQCQSIFA